MTKKIIENTVEVPEQHRGAEVRSSSFNESDNSIEVVWTAGARARRNSWFDGPFDEELEVSTEAIRLDRLNAGAPFLDSHSSYELRDVIGSVIPGSAKIAAGIGTARVLLSRTASDADVVSKIKDGIIRNISVGYRIHKVIKTEGQEGDVPLHRVVDWEPLEISAVAIPADTQAHVRSDKAGEGQRTYPCIIVPETSEGGPNMADKTQGRSDTPAGGSNANPNPTPETEQRAALVVAQAGITQEDVTRAAGEAATVASRAAIESERRRVSEITDLATRGGVADFGREHAAKDTSVDNFRTLLLEKLMSKEHRDGQTNSNIPATVRDETTETARAAAIENALLHRSDMTTFKLTVDGARDFVGMSLMELARESLQARGVNTRGMSKMDVAANALNQRSGGIGGLHSTSDFPAILGNVLNRTLRAGYDAAPQTFRPFTRETTVPDFKEVSRVQLGDAPQLDKVNEHGEFKRGTLGEASEKYSIATYGKVVGITRQVLINDDLGAFTRIPRAFGVQAAQLESDLVWAQILANPMMGDGKTLFHAGHKNLGTAGGVTVDNLSAMRTAFGMQTGIDGKTVLNLTPGFIIVPKKWETATEILLKGAITPAVVANVVPESMRRLEIISEPRLDNGIPRFKIAGDANAWYLIGDPAMNDTVELAYLEGQQGLYTETRMGFDVDGVETKVRLDVGAKALDWRSFAKNPFAG